MHFIDTFVNELVHFRNVLQKSSEPLRRAIWSVEKMMCHCIIRGFVWWRFHFGSVL